MTHSSTDARVGREVAGAPEPQAQLALEARSLAHRYRRGMPWALAGVDLAIPSGTIVALVGPNGAGKSTLIRSWIGFERPTRGAALVHGIDARRDPVGAIRRIGYVSQSGGLYRGLSIRQHLDLALTLRGTFDRELAADRLARLHIPLHRRGGDLSGGQAAHVELALALGTRPDVFLLDEPLSSLDPLARHEFLSVLAADVHSRSATALLSSHIVSDVETICDSVVVLGDGQVMLNAPIDTARHRHRLAPGTSASGIPVVASFVRPGGSSTTLIQSQDPSLEAPTLEELVMGYLSAARDRGDRRNR